MEATHAYYKHLHRNQQGALSRNERVKILKKHPNDDGYTIYVPSLNRERETISERLDFVCVSDNYKCFMCEQEKNVKNEKAFFVKYKNRVNYGCASCAFNVYNLSPPQKYFVNDDNSYWEINEHTYYDKTLYYRILLDILENYQFICNVCNTCIPIKNGINIQSNINICNECNEN